MPQIALDPNKARRVTSLDPTKTRPASGETPAYSGPSMMLNQPPANADRFTVPTVMGNLPMSRATTEQFGRNIVTSSGRLVTDFASALAHPLRTGGTVLDLLAGTADKLFPSGEMEGRTGEQKVDALLNFYAERYGGRDQILKAIMEDPAGVAADIATVAGAGGGLLGAGGRVSRIPLLERSGAGLMETANAIDPIYQMGRTVAAGGRGLMRTTGRVASETLGVTTGTGGEAIRTGVMAPSDAAADFRRAMRGQIDDIQIVRDARAALNDLRVDRGNRYAARAGEVFADAPEINLTPIRDQAAVTLRNRHIGYGFNSEGRIELDFSQSPITEAGDQNRILSAVDDLNEWASDPARRTAEAADALKQRLQSYRMAAETPRARGVISEMESGVRSLLREKVPGYQAMTSEYENLSEMIDMIDRELSLSSNNPGTAVRKLSSALSQRSPYRQMLLDALDDYSGSNLREKVAGRAMSEWAPAGLMNPTRSLPTAAGIGAAGYVSLPLGVGAAASTSPRTVGEVLLALGMLRRGVLRPVRTGLGTLGDIGTRAFVYNPAIAANRSATEQMIGNTQATISAAPEGNR